MSTIESGPKLAMPPGLGQAMSYPQQAAAPAATPSQPNTQNPQDQQQKKKKNKKIRAPPPEPVVNVSEGPPRSRTKEKPRKFKRYNPNMTKPKPKEDSSSRKSDDRDDRRERRERRRSRSRDRDSGRSKRRFGDSAPDDQGSAPTESWLPDGLPGFGGRKKERSRESRRSEDNPVKLKVNGLHRGSYNAGMMLVQLQEIFDKVAQVKDIDIPVNTNGRVKGWAYIDVSNDREAQECISKFSGMPYDDDKLRVERYFGEVGTYEYYNGQQRRRGRGGRGGGGRGGRRGGGGGGRGRGRY